jgi:hypothetical protein
MSGGLKPILEPADEKFVSFEHRLLLRQGVPGKAALPVFSSAGDLSTCRYCEYKQNVKSCQAFCLFFFEKFAFFFAKS